MKLPAWLAGFPMTKRHPLRWTRNAFTALWLSALLCVPALAEPLATDSPEAETLQAFELVVQTDDASIRAWLEQHLELQRYKNLNDLDDAELTRLLHDADGQARDLLATQGYFQPQLRWTQGASDNVKALRKVQVDVLTGPAARVTDIQWHWQGDIASNPLARAQQNEIVRQWALPPGQKFTQIQWTQAKNQALRQLVAQRYPWGRIVESQALVDADTQQVRLDVTIDSGPSVSLGPVEIVGAHHYGTAQVSRLARLSPGMLYRQSALLEAQQRLVSSGFYDSVFVSLDENGPADATPVKVELKEAPRQKWVLGLGVRSDSGARFTAEHTHHSVPGLGWRAVSKLAVDQNLQSLGVDLLAPPDTSLWRWNTSAKLEQQKLTGFDLNSQRWRAGRTQLGERIDRAYYAQYDWAQQVGSVQGQQEAVSGNYAWTWRHFDSLPFPSSGLGWGFELGAGVTLGSQHSPYIRWLTKGLFLQPIGAQAGRLAWRGELGSVVSKDISSLPSTQLFLAGGDHSVRGYALNSIGIDQANGLVLAGRYLATGSLEWQRPIVLNQQRTEWESAVFIDAGTVTNDLQQIKTRLGLGVGARWRSPVGPLRIDLAYGQATRKLRLHLNVGFTF